MTIRYLDHVHLAMPEGAESCAHVFYGRLLGIPDASFKPKTPSQSGCSFGHGTFKIHLETERNFRPECGAHPAFIVQNLRGLSTRLSAAGYGVTEAESIDGFDRIYVVDPFGHRIELVEPIRSLSFARIRS